MYKGDLGMFRSALMLSGFPGRSESCMFNDNHKDGSRRLKLWFADPVFDAPQKQQKALEKLLREAFGKRITSMYFTGSSDGYGRMGFGKSLCIQLRD